MPWTEITRPQYRRTGRRYASDQTDAERALVAPFMQEPSTIGRPRSTDVRSVVDALLYLAATGCQWRQLPKDSPPYSTVQGYFCRWAEDGTMAPINRALVMASREAQGHQAGPTASVIDSQPVETREGGAPRGYDASKKINGHKRHIVTDTREHLGGPPMHPVDIQDRNGAATVPPTLCARQPWPRYIFSDGDYAGGKLRTALAGLGRWTVEIIKRSDAAKGFEVLPRRRVVERTFARLGRCRRFAKDFEQAVCSATAWAFIAHIRILTRQLARA